MVDALGTAIVGLVRAFETRYRADHAVEHALLLDSAGTVIARRTGDADSVYFEIADLDRARGGYVTHTHPRALPPSGADVLLAAEHGLLLRAVGNIPDTGRQIDYTIAGLPPSLANIIPSAFDDAVEIAERELAKLPLSDLDWQRESRHLALTRLADRYGFAYSRAYPNDRLSEVTHAERVRLNTLGQVDTVLSVQVFAPLAASLVRLLVRASVGGVIPITALERLRSAANLLVQQTFLGRPDARGLLTPYTVQRGQMQSNSPYFTALLQLMRNAAQKAIDRHAAMMRKYLDADIARALEFATVSPFHGVAEAAPQYDPLHLWVGPDGKRLSDRIWNAAGDMRRKLDDYLTQAIARRTPVEQMAKELDAFLQPGQGAYTAYRLARTETTAAYARADWMSAQGNPFAETYSYFTAPSHKCCDECDVREAGSPYPKDDQAHLPPAHPSCVCGIRWNIVKSPANVMKALRMKIDQAVAAAKAAFTDVIGPLSKRFADLLFRG